MKEVGNYEWRQLSMWDFAPEGCILLYVNSQDNKHTFRYYLIRIVEVYSENSWKTEVVKSLENVPQDVLTWMGGKIKVTNRVNLK